MGRKRTPFIDKKSASTFHVVHRSQRDPERHNPEASDFVLLSSSQHATVKSRQNVVDDPEPEEQELDHANRPLNSMFKDTVNSLGFANDGYDYNQHLKEIKTDGHFYSASGSGFIKPDSDARSKKIDLQDENLHVENDRLLDAITVNTRCMDYDIRAALENENENSFEELDDSFILQATNTNEGNNDSDDDGFDYEAHIQKLMNAASNYNEDECFTDEEEEQEDNNDVSMDLLDEMFERVMEEYEDDQIGGDLSEDDETTTEGKLVLEGDLLEEILTDYVDMQQELQDDEGAVGNPLRAGVNELERFIAETEEEQRDAIDAPEEEPLPEEAPFQEYLTDTRKECWDVESIVSTYSNFDNHPTIIKTETKKKKNKNHIQLSNKSGMPLGIELFPVREEKSVENEQRYKKKAAPPVVTARSKSETAEEKRERKAAVKQAKAARRAEKKAVKSLFKDETARQKLVATNGSGTLGSVSTFK